MLFLFGCVASKLYHGFVENARGKLPVSKFPLEGKLAVTDEGLLPQGAF